MLCDVARWWACWEEGGKDGLLFRGVSEWMSFGTWEMGGDGEGDAGAGVVLERGGLGW